MMDPWKLQYETKMFQNATLHRLSSTMKQKHFFSHSEPRSRRAKRAKESGPKPDTIEKRGGYLGSAPKEPPKPWPAQVDTDE